MPEIPLEQPTEFKPVVIPDNVYQAKVKEYRTNVHPQYGESLIIDFEILTGPHAGVVIGGFASLRKLTKKTKLWRWAKNLGAPVPEQVGQTFNPDSLVGKIGRILTQQVPRTDANGKPFVNSSVKDVLSPEGAPTGQPSSQPAVNITTPTVPQPTQPQTPSNKMQLLQQFQGQEFTEIALLNLGFKPEEIQFLRTHGYIYEPVAGKLRLVGY